MKRFRIITRSMAIAGVIMLTAGAMRAIRIGQLDYNILSEEERTVDFVWVQPGDSTLSTDSLYIPESVTIDGKEYTVTETRKFGFEYFPGRFLDFPSSFRVINTTGIDDIQIEPIDSDTDSDAEPWFRPDGTPCTKPTPGHAPEIYIRKKGNRASKQIFR